MTQNINQIIEEIKKRWHGDLKVVSFSIKVENGHWIDCLDFAVEKKPEKKKPKKKS